MAKTYSRKQIYRMARRYHFERYNSGRHGYGDKYRGYTLAGLGSCALGTYFIVTSWRSFPSHDLCLAAAAIVGGVYAIAKYGSEWSYYAKLARDFAVGAVDGGLVNEQGEELGPCEYTPEGIVALFAARYPWII